MYNEDPELFVKELEEIAKLRSNSCIRPKEDVTGVTDLKRYYSQLHLLQNRFKLEGGDKGPFNFSWSDPYSGSLYTLPDFDYELASVLYNLGSLHSILGAAEKRDSSESMKVACTHFQCAAWAFHTLPDRYPKVYTPDISPDLMAVMSQICLAQAQECILEKSILDHRKSSIISKVGTQVSEYYFAALHKLETSNARHLTSDILLLGGAPPGEETVMESIGHKNNADWIRKIEFKFVYHKAVAHLYAGLNSEESQKMGERITHYQASLDKLMECAKLASSNAKDGGIWREALTFSNDVIKGKLDNAKKENEFIYHEKVPELDTLVELKGASLVKGIGFEVTDREVAGLDIFSRLVPLEAHEASSLYSEEKAKLLRVIGEEIESKNNELALFMSSMSLDEDGVVPKPDEHIALPQELIEVAASLSVKGEDNVTVHLKNAMSRIAAVSAEVEASLKEIRDILKDNEGQEQEFSSVVNIDKESSQAGRKNVTKEVSIECEKFEGAHKMASDSNSTLHNAIRLHMDNLKLLTLPLDKLQKEIPSMADLDEESEANVAEVRRILLKVEEMKEQRKTLESSLRNDLMEDDITKKLVLHKDKQLPEIFEIEMKKHDQASKLLRTNLSAQSNIVKALTEVNAKYVETRRIISDLTNSRNEMIGSLVASFYAHEDLLHKATKGLEFYDKLDSNVTKLLHRVQGVIKVHQEERDAVIAKCSIKHSSVKVPPMENISNYYPHAPPMCTDRSPSIEKDIGLNPYLTSTKLDGFNERQGAVVSPVTGSKGADITLNEPVSVPTGKPTLKDYLKIMKENKSDASAAFAAMNYPGRSVDEKIGGEDFRLQSQSSGLPAVRPAPVGSESVESSPSNQFQHGTVSSQQTYNSISKDSSSGIENSYVYPTSYTPQTAFNHASYENNVSSPYPPNSQLNNVKYPISSTSKSNVMSHDTTYQIPGALPVTTQFPTSHVQTSYYTTSHTTPNVSNPYWSNLQSMSTSGQTVNDPLKINALHANQTMSNQSSVTVSNYISPSNMAIRGPFSGPSNMQTSQSPVSSVVSTHMSQAYVRAPQSANPNHMVNNIPYSNNTGYIPTTIASNIMTNQTPNIQPSLNPYGHSTNIAHGNSNNLHTPQLYTKINQVDSSIGSNFAPTLHQVCSSGNNQRLPASQGNSLSHYSTPPLQSDQSESQHVVQQNMYANQPPSLHTSVYQNNWIPPLSTQTPSYGHNYVTANQNYGINQTSSSELRSHLVPQGNQQNPIYSPQNTIGSTTNVNLMPQAYQSTSSQQNYLSATSNNTCRNPIPRQIYPNTIIPPTLRSSNPQQTYPNAIPQQPTQNINQQHVYHNTSGVNQIYAPISTSGTSMAPVKPFTGKISEPNTIQTEFKMKPIVPQPGTKPLTPNVSSVPCYPNNTKLIASDTSNPINHQSQAITDISVSQTANSNPMLVKRSSSFDDMLNNEQDDVDASSVITLQPKILTPGELAEQKRQAKALSDIVNASNRDPYEDVKNQEFLKEDIDMLENRFLSTSDGKDQIWLDEKWKLYNSFVTAGSAGNSEHAFGGGTLSVARCYPMKNRAPDILPFDNSRVELPTTKDDYINASHIRHLSPHAPNFIVTQWPPANTHNDFWTMVWQEQIEIIVCLLKDAPVVKDVYWPTERKDVLKVASPSTGGKSTAFSLDITLQSVKFEGKTEEGKPSELCRTERTFTILNKETNTSRVVIQIQLEINANMSGKPLIHSLSDLSSVCLAYHRQQRVLTHPIVAHCLDGSGRTASFILMVAAASEIDVAVGTNKEEVNCLTMSNNTDNFNIFPDLVKMAALMAQQRKGVLRERHHFKNAYEGMIMHSKKILIKKGALKVSEANDSDKSIRLQDLGTVETNKQNLENIISVVAEEVNKRQKYGNPDNVPEETQKNDTQVVKNHSETEKKTSSSNFFSAELLSNNLSDLNLADPLGLSNSRDSPQRKRITKQDFLNASTSSLSKIGKDSADDNDPLSKLDPLWSMK